MIHQPPPSTKGGKAAEDKAEVSWFYLTFNYALPIAADPDPNHFVGSEK